MQDFLYIDTLHTDSIRLEGAELNILAFVCFMGELSSLDEANWSHGSSRIRAMFYSNQNIY